jgi:glycosyltransferase involved in cell wall biosynthesis
MPEPLISVIMPVYNVEPYIRKSIDSVVNQTYKDLEIILIDDGSTDSSGKICDEYAVKDKRIVVIHQENAGVSVARNRGLLIFRGEYLAFVDSDDYIDQDMIEVLYQNLLVYQADMTACYSKKIYLLEDAPIYEKQYCSKIVYEDKEELLKDFYLGNLPWEVWGKLYARKVFGRELFDNHIRYAEDALIWLTLSKNIHKAVFVHYRKYNYILRQNSLGSFNSFNNICIRLDDSKVMQKVRDDLRSFGSGLSQVGEMRFCFSIMYLFKALQINGTTDQYTELTKIYQKEVCRDWPRIFNNPFLTIKDKITLLLIGASPHIFYIFYSAYRNLKGI